MKLSLIGFMGSGKSTIGFELAKKLEHEVIEMDVHVLANTNSKDMNEVFQKGGEKLLRDWEVKLAEEWRDLHNVIISTGGGVVLNRDIIDYLRENNGKIIYLHAPFEAIAERVQKDQTPRPLFQNLEDAKNLYNYRLPLYRSHSDISINTHDKQIEEIVNEIMNSI